MISNLANLVQGIPALYESADPVSLWSLSNSIDFSSAGYGINGVENQTDDNGEFSWTWDWEASLWWEVKSTASWNISDVVNPLTDETTHMRLNPILDSYAFVEGFFKWMPTTDLAIKIDAYVQPITTELLNLELWKSVNYPDFWTSFNNEEEVGDCIGLMSTTKPFRT